MAYRPDTRKPKSDPTLMTFRYCWLHIPTGRDGISEVSVHSKEEFLELLSKWNGSGRGVWQYWWA
jgi:hypothetical protein